MTLLLLGLVLFIGAHSVRIVAEPLRTRVIALRGEQSWKSMISFASLAGFVAVVYGYGLAREASVVLWAPPLWLRHVAALLTLPSFVLLVAAYVRGNRIKAKVGHPMIAGVKLWAFAHLLTNGTLPDVVLFGTFLVWAIADFIVSRRRDRIAGTRYPVGAASRDVITLAVGVLAWGVFAFYLHGPLIGVRPFG